MFKQTLILLALLQKKLSMIENARMRFLQQRGILKAALKESWPHLNFGTENLKETES